MFYDMNTFFSVIFFHLLIFFVSLVGKSMLEKNCYKIDDKSNIIV